MAQKNSEGSARSLLMHLEKCIVELNDRTHALPQKKRRIEVVWNGQDRHFYTNVDGQPVRIYEDEIAEWYPASCRF